MAFPLFTVSQLSLFFQVTGGSGFIGYHILSQLLNNRYFVRAAARGKKIELLKKALSANYSSDRFEVIEVADITSGDLSQYLKGVDGIIHAAAPLPGRVDVETAFKISIEGSLHILREAVHAKVPRVVVTSSIATFPLPQGPFGANDLAVVEFAEKHTEIDVTLAGPAFTYGPFAPGFECFLPEPDLSALSTNESIYALLRPGNTRIPIAPGAIDVRDAARAHILALKFPPSTEVGPKRFAIVSPHRSSYRDALTIIAKERPELKDRLTDATLAREWSLYTFPVEWQKIDDVLGLKADSFILWDKTALDTVDSLVHAEGLWKEKGFEVPPLFHHL
ncbi:NAD(P)-binding protein [Guyanagaster necrorhizus]|uniref:NAD(P)-binding protein n=1 Tax=Guyanagaster necrorhizus TaxID=856835 RepID=A0A9P7VYY5_9AGAR|nr:NAD(P)-binding protein [Guyanagaster necrorhizus MCA 3950]KAG7448829.1 NAD(P)-binding protein [Guyanagaster necrorhizus MCA 3950]